MDEYRHHVSGFFAHREEAEGADTRLLERGVAQTRSEEQTLIAREIVGDAVGEFQDIVSKVPV